MTDALDFKAISSVKYSPALSSGEMFPPVCQSTSTYITEHYGVQESDSCKMIYNKGLKFICLCCVVNC